MNEEIQKKAELLDRLLIPGGRVLQTTGDLFREQPDNGMCIVVFVPNLRFIDGLADDLADILKSKVIEKSGKKNVKSDT